MPRARNPQSNRSDLSTPKAAPNQTAPKQTYGKRTAQQQSMKIQPLTPPGASAPGAGGPAPTAPTPVQTTSTPDFASMLAGVRVPAGTLGDLARPTERPDVPVTNGLPTGPGPGPEALRGFAAQGANMLAQQGSARDLIKRLAAQPNASSALQQLAANA